MNGLFIKENQCTFSYCHDVVLQLGVTKALIVFGLD
jgi:hypothetical protein